MPRRTERPRLLPRPHSTTALRNVLPRTASGGTREHQRFVRRGIGGRDMTQIDGIRIEEWLAQHDRLTVGVDEVELIEDNAGGLWLRLWSPAVDAHVIVGNMQTADA